MYRIAIRNNVLHHWENLPDSERNYIDLLNDIIPDNSVKVKQHSTRVRKRIQVECFRLEQKLKKKNRSGSREQRGQILDSWTNIAILASDIMTPGELEAEVRRLEEKVRVLMERLDNLNVEVEEWRRKHEDVEEEKRKMFEEMQEETINIQNKTNDRITELEKENVEIKKIIRKLEREENNSRHPVVKDTDSVCERTIHRRLETVATRAKKALWFTKQFGLELDSLQVRDIRGNEYRVKISPSHTSNSTAQLPTPPATPTHQAANSSPSSNSTPTVTHNSPVLSATPVTPPTSAALIPVASTPINQKEKGLPNSLLEPENQHSTPGASPKQQPQPACPTTSPPCKWKQYDSLSDSDKAKVESVLFLMDKFAVGDSFVHELTMLSKGMPRSYLIKQCRDKLNSTCAVKPTPGPEPGAQISFKDSLVNKLKQLVSF